MQGLPLDIDGPEEVHSKLLQCTVEGIFDSGVKLWSSEPAGQSSACMRHALHRSAQCVHVHRFEHRAYDASCLSKKQGPAAGRMPTCRLYTLADVSHCCPLSFPLSMVPWHFKTGHAHPHLRRFLHK